MAVVAGSGAVRVPADASVLVVRLRLCMGCGRMTVDTRKLRVVCRDLMAIRTHRAVVWDSEPGVIKRRPGPRGRRVAGVAGRRIAGGDVVRDGAAERLRAVPVRRVAAVAVGVGACEVVVVADMARDAGPG